MYAGAFTKNDQLTASPFDDAFLFIPGVPAGVASTVLATLNKNGADERKRALAPRRDALWGRGHVEHVYRAWLAEMDARDGLARRAMANATLGYVTADACPGVGDDTLHAPLPFFGSPDFIASNPPAVPADTPIDLVFVDFIEDQLLGVLNAVQSAKNYTEADVSSYTPILANAVLGLFAQKVWN